MKTKTVPPRPYGMGLTAHQPPAKTNGEESIGKPNTKKTNIKMYRSKETLQQAPQNKRKNSYGTKCRRSGKDKTTVACCLGEFPEPNGLGARRDTGGLPGNRRAPDFRNIQGDSAIPWNTVTSTSCDRRVNRVAGEEGEGSHPARRATQQRGCQPQRIDQGLTGRNYRSSRVVPCYRRESVTTGKDPGRKENPRRREKKGAVRCQLCVAVRCRRI